MFLLGINIVNGDGFLIFEIVDENRVRIDSVVITKYTPENVIHFYSETENYVEEYTAKIKALTEAYSDKLDFDEVSEKRGEAEFILFSCVMGIN